MSQIMSQALLHTYVILNKRHFAGYHTCFHAGCKPVHAGCQFSRPPPIAPLAINALHCTISNVNVLYFVSECSGMECVLYMYYMCVLKSSLVHVFNCYRMLQYVSRTPSLPPCLPLSIYPSILFPQLTSTLRYSV